LRRCRPSQKYPFVLSGSECHEVRTQGRRDILSNFFEFASIVCLDKTDGALGTSRKEQVFGGIESSRTNVVADFLQ
jgi:hypothetical protein